MKKAGCKIAETDSL